MDEEYKEPDFQSIQLMDFYTTELVTFIDKQQYHDTQYGDHENEYCVSIKLFIIIFFRIFYNKFKNAYNAGEKQWVLNQFIIVTKKIKNIPSDKITSDFADFIVYYTKLFLFDIDYDDFRVQNDYTYITEIIQSFDKLSECKKILEKYLSILENYYPITDDQYIRLKTIMIDSKINNTIVETAQQLKRENSNQIRWIDYLLNSIEKIGNYEEGNKNEEFYNKYLISYSPIKSDEDFMRMNAEKRIDKLLNLYLSIDNFVWILSEDKNLNPPFMFCVYQILNNTPEENYITLTMASAGDCSGTKALFRISCKEEVTNETTMLLDKIIIPKYNLRDLQELFKKIKSPEKLLICQINSCKPERFKAEDKFDINFKRSYYINGKSINEDVLTRFATGDDSANDALKSVLKVKTDIPAYPGNKKVDANNGGSTNKKKRTIREKKIFKTKTYKRQKLN